MVSLFTLVEAAPFAMLSSVSRTRIAHKRPTGASSG
jgi:hypothetical protein